MVFQNSGTPNDDRGYSSIVMNYGPPAPEVKPLFFPLSVYQNHVFESFLEFFWRCHMKKIEHSTAIRPYLHGFLALQFKNIDICSVLSNTHATHIVNTAFFSDSRINRWNFSHPPQMPPSERLLRSKSFRRLDCGEPAKSERFIFPPGVENTKIGGG